MIEPSTNTIPAVEARPLWTNPGGSTPALSGRTALRLCDTATLATAAAFAVPVGELRATTRRSSYVALARQSAMYLSHVAFGVNLSAVGRAFGRDRTTAAYACRLIEDRRDDPAIEAVITTGGTGVTGRDVTPEALEGLFEKKIEGFGETFRWVSFQKIGTSTMQSRATAGVANGTYIFALPGSTGACRDGWDEILKWQLDIRFRPCNFAELMPRLNEGKIPRSG